MAKNAITDYDTNPANNTDVGSIGVEGTNIPSNFDNSQREIMSHLADMNAGTSPLHDTFAVADPSDLTKKVRIDAGNVTAGQTRVLTMPDEDITLKNLSNVNNTSDANKPVSTAQQTAIDAKLNVSGGDMSGSIALTGDAQFSYGLDSSGRTVTVASGANVAIVHNFSGLIIVNNHTSGQSGVAICGGGLSTIISTSSGSATFSISYASGQAGYSVVNNAGSTQTYSIMALRTRSIG